MMNRGAVPFRRRKKAFPGKFPNIGKGRPLKVVVFGGSISVEASAIGKCAPWMPRWDDVMIICFSMNDAGRPFSTEQFIANTQSIMDSIRAQNSDAEFILLMSFQNNPKWRSLKPMIDYLEALKALEGPGVAVVDMWTMHGYLLENKTYWDMTGNHVNHPNDFLVRIYAQTLLATLGVE